MAFAICRSPGSSREFRSRPVHATSLSSPRADATCSRPSVERQQEPRQTFYAGLRKPRELTHDAGVYRAYLRAEERLRSGGADVRRVILDYELKREYQQFLQERNRGRPDSTGRQDREPEEIEAWAREHDLPFFDGSVHFPDARLETSRGRPLGSRQDVRSGVASRTQSIKFLSRSGWRALNRGLRSEVGDDR
jgi:hypothetical protein